MSQAEDRARNRERFQKAAKAYRKLFRDPFFRRLEAYRRVRRFQQITEPTLPEPEDLAGLSLQQVRSLTK